MALRLELLHSISLLLLVGVSELLLVLVLMSRDRLDNVRWTLGELYGSSVIR